jgi:hypothetical protein
MAAVDDVDQLMGQYQLALGEFVKGNPDPVKELYSHRDDVTLANPLGPPARGWEQVTKTIEHAASNIRDGEITSFDVISKLVTAELDYTVDRAAEGQNGRKAGRYSSRPAGYDDP